MSYVTQPTATSTLFLYAKPTPVDSGVPSLLSAHAITYSSSSISSPPHFAFFHRQVMDVLLDYTCMDYERLGFCHFEI